MLSKTQLENISQRQKLTMSLTIVILMVTSTMLVLVQDLSSEEITPTYVFRECEKITQTSAQSTEQGGQGTWAGSQDSWQLADHPVLSDIKWTGPGVASGILADQSAIAARMP